MAESLHISWCGDRGRANELANFFARNVDAEYISHSELQGRRAPWPGQWHSNLVQILQDEIEPRLAATRDGAPRGDESANSRRRGKWYRCRSRLRHLCWDGHSTLREHRGPYRRAGAARPGNRQGSHELDRDGGACPEYLPAISRKRYQQRTCSSLFRARRLPHYVRRHDAVFTYPRLTRMGPTISRACALNA